jgi:A/G-specific adenine glycosylase
VIRSKQSAFAGSDRQGRGRLVEALRAGPVSRGRLAEACGWPGDTERATRVAESLVVDGLARPGRGGGVSLP